MFPDAEKKPDVWSHRWTKPGPHSDPFRPVGRASCQNKQTRGINRAESPLKQDVTSWGETTDCSVVAVYSSGGNCMFRYLLVCDDSYTYVPCVP